MYLPYTGIERIQFEQVSTSKAKLVGIDQTLSIQSVSRGNPLSIGFFARKKSKKGMLLPF